jgi:hypothetical protein
LNLWNQPRECLLRKIPSSDSFPSEDSTHLVFVGLWQDKAGNDT